MSASVDPFVTSQNIRPVPERQEIIPSFYQDHVSPKTVVRANGIPIEHGGIQLTVGLVPPERRYAIDPDGNVLDQRDFEPLHGRAYRESYAFVGQPSDNATLRYVPNAISFVQQVIDPTDRKRLIPFHMLAELERSSAKVVEPPKELYSPGQDKMIDRNEVAEAKPDLPVEHEVTPCGKSVTHNRVKNHVRLCKEEACRADPRSAYEDLRRKRMAKES